MGNFEFVMKVVYVLMLGLVGGAMFIESLANHPPQQVARRRKPVSGARWSTQLTESSVDCP